MVLVSDKRAESLWKGGGGRAGVGVGGGGGGVRGTGKGKDVGYIQHMNAFQVKLQKLSV